MHESDSLHAVQKMDFESIVRDVTNKYKILANGVKNATNRLSTFKLNDIHVPIVHVNNKFELFENALTWNFIEIKAKRIELKKLYIFIFYEKKIFCSWIFSNFIN